MVQATNNEKAIKIVKIIVLGALLISSVIFIISLFGNQKYQKVEATVTDVTVKSEYSSGPDRGSTVIKRVYCSYVYDGEEYETDYRTLFKNYHKGEDITVLVDPDTPESIKDPFLTESSICIVAFLAVFSILLFKIEKRDVEQ